MLFLFLFRLCLWTCTCCVNRPCLTLLDRSHLWRWKARERNAFICQRKHLIARCAKTRLRMCMCITLHYLSPPDRKRASQEGQSCITVRMLNIYHKGPRYKSKKVWISKKKCFKKLKLLFSKGPLNGSNVIVKTFIMLQKISNYVVLLNFFCSKNPGKNNFFSSLIIMRNISSAANQQIMKDFWCIVTLKTGVTILKILLWLQD